jgi:class 3 adenylate cyclase/tRNA A-37 threonylcarbamoyl transferase component Bud32/tetratricopeptide (TPR) repeat protein
MHWQPTPGTKLGTYVIASEIGRGGMATVYLAEHTALGRKVALKILASDLAEDEEFRRRFVRESRMAAALEHANIVPIYDAGEAEGLLYLSMRYIQGTDLKSLLAQEGTLDPARISAIVRQVAAALDAAHAKGLIHRDVKPANILLERGHGADEKERAYLADFGLARSVVQTSSHTQAGTVFGTLDYMAPEQMEGKPIDARTDLYALGCVLYECLVGSPPFHRETAASTISAHLHDEPRPPSSIKDTPLALDTVIAIALAKDAADRYRSCGELAQVVGECFEGASNRSVAPMETPAPSVLTCPNCSKENPQGFRFCGFCSTPLTVGAGGAGEERKLVTILFCELLGFAASADAADPEDVRATLRPYHALLREAIEDYGGTVEKFVGDAVMAAFGAPTAHEDDPERAIRSGLRILGAIEELNAARHLTLAVRMGTNTGEAVVSLGASPAEGEGFVTGDVVNVASRLQGVAPVSGIVVGEGTYWATRYLFDYEELEPVTLKGKAEPMPIWRPLAPISRFGAEVDLQPATPFVGRELERKLLEGLYARAVKETSVQLVTITGEPGIGKSRLVGELSTFVDEQEELVSWRQGRCLPYGEEIAFWALGEIVKAQAGILESDDAESATRRLDLAVEAVIGDESDRAWVRARLAPLVGLLGGEEERTVERRESFTAWTRFLEGVAASQPLVLVVEDLHWADEAMLAFLEHLVEWASGVSIQVVCTARPELFERNPGWGAATRNATRIALEPLSDEETALLVSSLLQRSVLPAEAQAMLLERASGNPLYAEEFVRVLRDRGLIDEAGRVADNVASGNDDTFPESVQALIAARLDTLAQDRKALLQDAAVVGKVFWSGAVAAMSGVDEGSIEQLLHELIRKELIRPSRTSSVAGQTEYVFWHALVREVAYGQIPRSARAAKHRAAAQWMEATAGERAPDVAELLVSHYRLALELATAAGHDSETLALREPLRRALVMAAGRAASLDAERAEAAWRDALELTPAEDADRPRLQLSWGKALKDRGHLREAVDAMGRAAAEFELQGNEGSQAVAIARQGQVLQWLGSPNAGDARDRALAIIGRIAHCPETVEVLTYAAGTSWLQGDRPEAVSFAERAISVAQELGLPEPVVARGVIGGVRSELGEREGLDDLGAALQASLDRGPAFEALHMYNNLAYSLQALEGPAAALGLMREGVTFARRRGLDPFFGKGTLMEALTEAGEWDEAMAVGEELSVWSEGTENSYDLLETRCCLARILALRGRFSDLAGHLEWARDYAHQSGLSQDVAVVLCLAVIINRGMGEIDAARATLTELLETPGIGDEPAYAFRLPELVRVALQVGVPELPERLVGICERLTAAQQHALRTTDALLAEDRGDSEAAVEAFADAASRWSRFGVPYEEAQAELGLSRCLFALGRLGVQDHLAVARAIFQRLGASSAISEADALLASIGASAS